MSEIKLRQLAQMDPEYAKMLEMRMAQIPRINGLPRVFLL